jgi:energy-converting hydrogenase Eha subunit C
MNKWLELIVGLILLVGVIALVFPGMPLESWGNAALTVLKGGLVWIVALVGLILIILGISEIKG